ncbi:MAG: DUF481 domain-containing protein [Desulfobacterales bacterium]|nr:DUF481 domain-containing protein [Desulfobacterales bacterium]
MKEKVLAIFCLSALVLLNSARSSADEVLFKNGDRITGRVLSLENGILAVKTSYAGKLAISWAEVANIKTDEPIRVVLKDQTSAQGVVAPGEAGKATIKAEQIAAPIAFNLSDVKTINPRPSLRIDARINFGLNISEGNSNTQNIYGDGELIVRTDTNRYTLGAVYERSEQEEIKIADRIFGYSKYDHFFTKKWYSYANLTAEKDEFKDLDLRTSLGIGAGHQFIESARSNLSFEGGLSYVDENYMVAEDVSYLAGRWGLKFDHYLLPSSLQYFLNHTGWQSVEDSENLILYTQTGIRIPIYKRMNLTAQFNWDYNKSPSPGTEKNDYTYILTVGYEWGN